MGYGLNEVWIDVLPKATNQNPYLLVVMAIGPGGGPVIPYPDSIGTGDHCAMYYPHAGSIQILVDGQ
jgi:hypothetical protein